MDSLKSAVSDELARAKIEANQVADRISVNLAALHERADVAHLFPDASAIVLKAPEDLLATMAARISEHEAKEAARLEAERERIRQEEAARAAREVAQDAIEKAAETPAPAKAFKFGNLTVTQEQFDKTYPLPAAKKSEDGPVIKLSQINERIAPLSITADGLASIGFAPVRMEKSAKLYLEADFPAICAALVEHISKAAELQPA